jgi:hypothetical protein
MAGNDQGVVLCVLVTVVDITGAGTTWRVVVCSVVVVVTCGAQAASNARTDSSPIVTAAPRNWREEICFMT